MKTRFIASIQISRQGLEKNYSAYCPGLPCYIAHGATEEEALAALEATLAQQIGPLGEFGIEPPVSHCSIEMLQVEAQEEEQNGSEYANLNRMRLH